MVNIKSVDYWQSNLPSYVQAHLIEGRLKLCTTVEQSHSSKHIETKTSPGHGHHQTSHISQVTHMFGANQRQNNVVVLLTLIPINCCYLQEWHT